MKAKDAFPGAHLKWEDLEQRPARLTIDSVEMGTVGQGTDAEQKPIMSFQGTERTLVLNKTNFNRIAYLTQQPDSDNWRGHQITLAKDVTEFQGKTVNCIRVQVNGAAVAPPMQAPQPVQPATQPLRSTAPAPLAAPALLGAPVLEETPTGSLSLDDIPFGLLLAVVVSAASMV